MKTKKLVKVYLEFDGHNHNLIIKPQKGEEMLVSIFNGGGYYTDLWFRTRKQIEQDKKDSIKALKEEDKRIRERLQIKSKVKWYEFWN